MRRFIFTVRERLALAVWLEDGVENVATRRIFTEIRKFKTPIREDLELMLRVIRRLQGEKRWHGRVRLG